MKSYAFKRRAFLAGLGGAFGFRILLENLEASAQGVASPPRFMMLYWPTGTIRYHYLPTGTGTSYVTSRILQPFETAGLRSDMIGLYGLSPLGITSGSGGTQEVGTVMVSTGANIPGTRDNMGEDDDAVAGGPSFDQIFLRRVPELQKSVGPGFVNGIADARVDSYETSAQCLSYAYETRQIASARPGGLITEHTPQLPFLSPLEMYSQLFSGFVPDGGTDEVLKALRMKKSVLDSALREMGRVRDLAPASERVKLDAHAEGIRKVEQEITGRLGMPGMPACTVPPAPPAELLAKSGSSQAYGNPQTETEDAPSVEAIGKAMLSVVRAAFQCDIIRVATFQWCSGSDHVSFKGMYPPDPEASYMHHPLSHRIGSSAIYSGPPPSSATDSAVFEFMTSAHTWFNQKTADVLAEWKNATDVFGGRLLDHTIVPFVTDSAEPAGTRNSQPALIFGGRALGMQGGQFQNFLSAQRSQNDLWMTIAQAYLKTNDPLPAFAEDVFVKTNVSPIPGLWAPV